MDKKFKQYTGSLNYKDIDFIFFFDKEELCLFPPEDKKHVVEGWTKKPVVKGVYTKADPMPVEEKYLIGVCNETGQKIAFIPKPGTYLQLSFSITRDYTVVRIQLAAYAIYKLNRNVIDRISFTCPEINYIHPVNQAVSLMDTTEPEKGIIKLSTQDYDATTTETQVFTVDDKEVKAYFGISRNISLRIDEPPLSLESALIFEFEPTNDYGFIYQLWWIAREFIRFLCYRKNVFIREIGLSAPYEGGKHERFATMILLHQDGKIEANTLKNGRIIKQDNISGQEGKILSDIADNKLYLRHIPESYRSGRHIDAARFVMITAAFEWEFRRLYPEGVEKSKNTVAAENSVQEVIQKHIAESTGKEKKIYKFLKKLVKSDSMEPEIIQMGKDFDEIVGAFGNRLYHINGQELNYSEMGRRLSDQRNHFAHGDLDQEFIGLSLLDLIYMEYLIYAMQLKYYGVENKNIQKAVNDLFHLGFAL